MGVQEKANQRARGEKVGEEDFTLNPNNALDTHFPRQPWPEMSTSRILSTRVQCARTLNPSFFTVTLRPLLPNLSSSQSLRSLSFLRNAARQSSIQGLTSSHRATFAPSGKRSMSLLGDHSIYGDEAPPPVSIKSVSPSEIELVDGSSPFC